MALFLSRRAPAVIPMNFCRNIAVVADCRRLLSFALDFQQIMEIIEILL